MAAPENGGKGADQIVKGQSDMEAKRQRMTDGGKRA